MTEIARHSFQAEVSQVLSLVVGSLYSHKEVFLRELISNAADALDRLRFESLTRPELLPSGEELKIRIVIDKAARTLSIEDNGIGMSEEELVANLGTIARSGTREFMKRLSEAQQAAASGVQLIGQFGVGFYSAFLVADEVVVTSRRAGSTEAYTWRSEAKEHFTVEPAERGSQGTSIQLRLKADQDEFLERYRIRSLIERYSDYISHPIEVGGPSDKPAAEGAAPETTFERVNRASALWQRNPKEVTEEQYREFYKHLTHDWEEPVTHRHFVVEGTQMFTGLLFLPGRAPFDLFDPTSKAGVRLHVRRVLVMENSEELLPKWLRFLRGVVDSEDLPLNVSRETLQDSRVVRTIRKQVTQHALTMLEQLATERPEDYRRTWEAFGAVLKEGLHFDPEERERLSRLFRFQTSTTDGWQSLADYVGRMKPDQEHIYYAVGPSRKVLEQSPHLEILRKHGLEVLLLTDPVDPFMLPNLPEFEKKPLRDAMTGDLSLPKSAEPEKADTETPEPLFEKMQSVLGDRVEKVRASSRLADSPACLVRPEGALAPHIERLLRARNMELPATKRVLEVNRDHPVMVAMRRLFLVSPDSPKLAEWIELLYDQSLLAEGSPIEDPAAFVQRISHILADAAEQALR